MSLRAELAALLRFLRAPRPRRVEDGAHWWPRVFVLAPLIALVLWPLDAVVAWLLGWSASVNRLAEASGMELVFGALLFAPIVEEFVYRAGLRSPRYTLCFGPLATLPMVMSFDRSVLAVAAVFALMALLCWRAASPGFAARRRFVERYATVFWGYAALFALSHLVNYEPQGPRGAVLPLLVLPQLAIGGLLGYIRLRDGIGPAMLTHFVINVIGVAELVATH